MSKTLVILNPHAAGGRAGKLWHDDEAALKQALSETAGGGRSDVLVTVTETPDAIPEQLEDAYLCGIRRIISVGGDGTNHALINALARLADEHPEAPAPRFTPLVYGSLPIGTGRDWARGIGMPTDNPRASAEWIGRAYPRPIDIGKVTFNSGQSEYFLNIASTGLGGEVGKRVNGARRRYPWTFNLATLQSILSYHPQPVSVQLDGKPWFDGRAFVIAVANGTTFGHGMKIAPFARVNDGLFDVVLVKAVSKLTILSALKRVYDGSHLTHPAVMNARAREVVIEGNAPIPLELDGEPGEGTRLHFEVCAGALYALA